MIDRFLSQTSFSSQEDFVKNLKIHVPDNFNFGYDIVDAQLPNNQTNRLYYGLMTKVNTASSLLRI